MAKFKDLYDVVIIGSGLAGMMTAIFLQKQGLQTCVLEKNAQIGGNLQTFKRDRTKFDTGVHYIGGVEKGQPFYPYLKYFDILDNIDLEKLDEDGYDRISFEGDNTTYLHGQGYEKFIQNLSTQFPGHESEIQAYCDLIQSTCKKFKLYRIGLPHEESQEFELFSLSAKEVIEGITSNKKLQSVLAGSIMLYAGNETSPFYIHALISNSYILSAYKMKYSDQMIKHLRKQLKELGGEIHINAEVVKLANNEKFVEHVELQDGTQIKGNYFVSNIHPTLTYRMLDTEYFRKVYTQRMLTLPNTISVFILYIKLKPHSIPYRKYNQYHFFTDDVWNIHEYDDNQWIKGLAIFNSPSEEHPEFTKTMCLMAYMKYDEVKQWEDTFNTTLSENDRGKEYLDFKEEKSKALISALGSVYPGIEEHIETYYSASPLTQRDYIGSIEGGIYGINRETTDPMRSFIRANTKLKNLFLAGQNTVLHGALGVTVSATLAASAILGEEVIIADILAKQD